MKKLLLVRHGKSSWDYPGLTDFERPLNERGRSNASALGIFFKEQGIAIDSVFSSPANRAISTARFVCQEIGYPFDKISIREAIYEAGPDDLIEVIKTFNDKDTSVIMFGHNPGFIMLSGLLTAEEIELFPTCMAFGIELDINQWKDIKGATGKCFLFQLPKKKIV